MLDIMEISEIHNRAPGGIISRLVKQQYIKTRVSARGYMKYKNSDLYKEIVANGENKRKLAKEAAADKKKEVARNSNKLNNGEYFDLQQDMMEMKNEIADLKKNIKELVEMMKAVYEFEDA